MQTIVRVLHLRHSVTYVFQRGEENTFAIKRVKQVGYDTEARLLLEDRDFTVVYFSEHPATVQVQDLAMEMERQKELLRKNPDPELTRQNAILQAVVQKLVSLEIAVVVPLHLNGQPIGLILLSEKLNGEGYHSGDLGLLEVVGGQAISSIQKAKLYEGDQMKSEFVSIASHELLTPISAIEGYLSMILEEGIGQVDPQARDYLTKVFTSAKRLSLLIKDLLSVSRIESGKMKIDPQQLDMNKMVTDTIDQLRFMASDKGLQLDFTRVDGLPPVWADPDRTMQVMVNLVSNAIKYTPKGNVTITVKADGKGFVTTAVKDTGLGMTKDAMKHLYTQFYRVDTPETAGIGGTGLGLYITKSIIEKMGGTISVSSEPNEGTTFSFVLPLFKVETSTIG
jgi:signal transduction histidine kinase